MIGAELVKAAADAITAGRLTGQKSTAAYPLTVSFVAPLAVLAIVTFAPGCPVWLQITLLAFSVPGLLCYGISTTWAFVKQPDRLESERYRLELRKMEPRLGVRDQSRNPPLIRPPASDPSPLARLLPEDSHEADPDDD